METTHFVAVRESLGLIVEAAFCYFDEFSSAPLRLCGYL